MVRAKSPGELGQIRGLGDFPLPDKIDSVMRPSKRHLKSTKAKELQKKKR